MDWKQLHLMGLGALLGALTAVGACSDDAPKQPLGEDDDDATGEEPADGEQDEGDVDAGKKPDSGKPSLAGC